MKTLKTIFMSIAVLFSALLVFTADKLLHYPPTNITIYTYPILILGAIFIIHWTIWYYYISELIPKQLMQEIKDNINIRIFSGVTGIGYLVVLCPITLFMNEHISSGTFEKSDIPEDYIIRGVSIIIIGVMFKAREILKYIIKNKLEQVAPCNRVSAPLLPDT